MGLTVSRPHLLSGRDCRVRVTGRSFFRGAVRDGHVCWAATNRFRPAGGFSAIGRCSPRLLRSTD